MPRIQRPRGPQLDLAGELCVAFVNTVSARKKNSQQGVGSYAELLTWGQQTGLVSTVAAEQMGERAAEDPEAAAAVYGSAAEVRLALFRIFMAVHMKKEMPAEDLALVNGALAAAMPAVRLVPGKVGLTWGWAGEGDALDRMLWPVLHSAAELLVSLAGRAQVRQCGGKGCRLFFVDRSPSGRRAWCERRTCGSREKSLRYYHRRGKHARSYPWTDR